jgi:hypothetical protein
LGGNREPDVTPVFYASGGGGAGGTHLDYQDMVVGSIGFAPDRARGYAIGVIGTLTPATSAVYSGADIWELVHEETDGIVRLRIDGLRANSGWSTITIGTTVFQRAMASYYQSGGDTYWDWYSSNVFGGSGGTRSITWD